MNQTIRYKILELFMLHYPKPYMELSFNSAFELLISVILSAKSTDKSVNKATSLLYSIANTPFTMLKLGLYRLNKIINVIGLHNKKSIYIIQTCKILVHNYQGKVPDNRIDLEKLPGVGRKTASIILNTIFHQPVIAVDTHVFRICNRTSFAIGKNVKEVESKLTKLVPIYFKYNLHNWFVLHGRYICTARNPNCNKCFINHLCCFHLINKLK
ncbi:Endonuclease III [Buchnera aphidicola (Thelaxes suberi)]|uniref:endonuclease III n=1 Tax=Buchnera aphidicola TaxID=9 RepID=UPI003463A0C7